MKIAILGNYPPKACGIATFTNSLARAILSNLNTDEISDFAEIIAIEDPGSQHDYPKEVGCILPRNERSAYVKTAEYLNNGGFDLLIVQHEYGIFGGDDGSYLLDLVDRLRIPLMMTCHTVLRDPSEGQCHVLRRLCVRTDVVVVMSDMARHFLIDIYSCPTDKIQVILHGVPEIDTADRGVLRQRFDWSDRRVLFTFGLLSRGKGIETVIRALPAVVEQHPNTLYVVLGETHPNVVRDCGEEYREWLHELAEELGVGDNLLMISKFASEQYLFECLKAADIYVIPYPNEAQITSGTLAYAVGAGSAVVSTPFWHASEILDEGRGHFFPFHDSDVLSERLLTLLGDNQLLQRTKYLAGEYGADTFWPEIGEEYVKAFADARITHESRLTVNALTANRPVATAAVGVNAPLPQLNLQHLYRMTDDCGLIQHAKYATPNRFEGYCLDDNGRGLLFSCMALESQGTSRADRQQLIKLSEIYLGYIYHAQHKDGSFRNFMSYGREWLEEQGSEDSYGRALWGLAKCITSPPRQDLADLAQECFIRAIGHLDQKSSPRTLAYGIIALSDYLADCDDENLRNLLDRSVNRLLDHYRDSRREGWDWFESYLTYDNALLPLALYRSLRILPKDHVQSIAEASSAFISRRTLLGGIPRPVGCHDVCNRGEEPSVFDQQPLELMADVLLYLEAYDQSRRPVEAARARVAYSWFYGNNDLAAQMIDPATGGCYDGLTAFGANKNQGAESLLAYLICTVAIQQLPNRNLGGTPNKQKTLKTMLNGFAPAWVEQRDSVSTHSYQLPKGLISVTALRQYDSGFLPEGWQNLDENHPFLR